MIISSDVWNAQQSWYRKDVIIFNGKTYKISLRRNAYDEQSQQSVSVLVSDEKWLPIINVYISLMPKAYRNISYVSSVDRAGPGLETGIQFLYERMAKLVAPTTDKQLHASVLLEHAIVRAQLNVPARRDELLARYLDMEINNAFDMSDAELEEIVGEDE